MLKKRMKSFGLGVGAGALAFTLVGGQLISHATTSESSAIYNDKATPATPAAANPAVLASLSALNQAFIALGEQVSPTVVNIYTTSAPPAPERQLPPGFEDELQRYFGGAMPFQMPPTMKREALGSGFVINAEEGYIVTNAHVVRMAGHNADETMVKFIGEENGRGHAAKIIGVDEISDVALLKLTDKKPGLKAAILGDSSKTRVAELVLAVGNPYGHTHTVTQGIVSAIGRNLEGARSDFIQTSAGINPGNSGGPLINMSGEVIAINSAMDPRAQNIGFAIPINTAKNVIDQLMNGGRVHRAFLGIAIEDLTADIAGYMHLTEGDGVLVRQVGPNTPAAKGGMQKLDLISKINGQPVHSAHDVYRVLDQLKVGSTAEIEVLRGGKSNVLKVQVGDGPN